MKTKKKDYPGCVFIRRNRIFVKYKGKQYKTGLEATPENIEIAKEKLREEYRRVQIRRGQLPLPKNEMQIVSLWDKFLHHLSNQGRLKKTMIGYRTMYNRMITDASVIFDEQSIISITDRLIARRDLSSGSKNIYLRHFQVFINFVLDFYNLENVTLRKIFRKYKLRATEKIVEPYTEAELTMLINEINTQDREFSILLLFMRYTGFRISETLDLTWDNFDYRNNVIRVPNKIDKNRIEAVPMSNVVQNLLSELRTYRIQGPLWRWKSSSRSTLSRRLSAIEKSLGIKVTNQGFHRLRNTFSNQILTSKDLTIPEMSDLMRHKNINTTYRAYHKANIQELGSKLDKIYSQEK